MNDAARREAGILYVKDGPVARVTIDRPGVLNALGRAAHAALSSVWDEVQNDPAIRVAILSGAGSKAFCAGTDLKDADAKNGVPYLWDGPRLGAGGLSFRRDLLKPVIAAVNGLALGTGFELALACDLIVAAEHAEFGFPEPRVGYMALDGGITMLTRQIPYKIAMGLLLTGRRMSARDGRAAGFVNEVAPPAALIATAERWAADIIECAPLSVEGTKQIAVEGRDLPSWASPRWFPRRVMEAIASEDSEEGTRAFRDKRPPRWKGR
jgi:enoyl-CoA hydratase/carnithine racemase